MKNDFLKSERGDTNLVGIIVLIGLAFLFSQLFKGCAEETIHRIVGLFT